MQRNMLHIVPENPSETAKLSTASQLLGAFDLFLIDAYGVLVTASGALLGAAGFLKSIEAHGKTYFIVTNDASRTPETCARVYRDCGLDIPVDKILSAGLAIGVAFQQQGLKNPSCAVLGTSETKRCVVRAGGRIVEITDDERDQHTKLEFDVLVIGDDSGFDVLPTMNALLNAIHKMARHGRTPKLFLANPDRLYPVGKNAHGFGEYGFASGSLAKLLEIGLKELAPELNLEFEILGKPAPLLFNLALSKTGILKNRTVMIGDTLRTDIAGARLAEISSALMATGNTQLPLPSGLAADLTPDFILQDLV